MYGNNIFKMPIVKENDRKRFDIHPYQGRYRRQ